EDEMKKLNKPYTPHIYDGAGHGFLRQQDGQNGANLRAAQAAWPLTVQWFHRYLRG
ncbi:MAG: dienelactone hydrolase family protein, partial [Gemmatimonadetes bacterium]|nr:dienelactone hydrolase family protein [Gemmatimonadota bacterium]